MDGPSRLATSPDKRALRRIGLVYVSDTEPGIRRERRGRGFCYRLPDGALVRDRQTLDRIRELTARWAPKAPPVSVSAARATNDDLFGGRS